MGQSFAIFSIEQATLPTPPGVLILLVICVLFVLAFGIFIVWWALEEFIYKRKYSLQAQNYSCCANCDNSIHSQDNYCRQCGVSLNE